MAEAQLAAWERFGYDVIDLENGTAALAEACGCEVEYPEHDHRAWSGRRFVAWLTSGGSGRWTRRATGVA